VEPEEIGNVGRCCGSGGLLKATDSAMSGDLAEKRLAMLQRTEANIIASACRYCDQNLAEALSKSQEPKRAQDLAELVAQQIGVT
jgi:Fe-S oxidoreductase